MRRNHKLSLAAEVDYAEIINYIAQNNPTAAKQVKAHFAEAFHKLAEHPHIGQLLNNITEKPVRFWNVYSYYIIYNPQSLPLMVLRIISNYRDVETLFND